QLYLGRYRVLYSALAKKTNAYWITGSIYERMPSGKYRNRAYIFKPDGSFVYQDKIHLTAYEKTSGIIESGEKLTVVATPWGNLGVLICYDSEFPALGHALGKAGVDLIAVPSCTETLHGALRIQISCQARALEQSVYVINACLVGECPYSEMIDVSTGHSGVFAPMDEPFPADGILAQAQTTKPELIICELDFEPLRALRQGGGAVHNYLDGHTQCSVEVLD
ncbi:MAG: hypothetical protein B7X06_01555, partial [Verrucomicrobia bacterium 21-51-4]